MDDLISRQEAIDALMIAPQDWDGMFIQDLNVRIREKIEALPSAQPVDKDTNVPCTDTISRKAAIDALKEHRNLFCDNTPDTFSVLPYGDKCRVDELDMAIATLINLPSAQPETHEDRTETHACDCISRSIAVEAVQKIAHIATLPDGDDAIRKRAVKYVLLHLPSAQPEIIHCRDCKYGDTFHEFDDPEMPMKCIGHHYGGTYPDDFCSYAERKE